MADYYRILGVTPDADQDQIRAEYLARARELHPDVVAGRALASERESVIGEANEKMALLNEAWRVLSDPERRRAYDRSLKGPSSPSLIKQAARTAGGYLGKLLAEYRKGRQQG